MILKIVDGKMNGKEDCIRSDYEYFVYECSIQNDKLFVRNSCFLLNTITSIIFSFNEALLTYSMRWNPSLRNHYSTSEQMIQHFNSLVTYFK